MLIGLSGCRKRKAEEEAIRRRATPPPPKPPPPWRQPPGKTGHNESHLVTTIDVKNDQPRLCTQKGAMHGEETTFVF